MTGVAYYAAARLAIGGTIMPEGIVVLWPANAILLAALLLTAPRAWPLQVAAAVAAEIAADLPTFTLLQAVSFSAVNVFEAVLAASLLRRAVGPRFRFDRLRSARQFVLLAMGVAAGVASLFGAAIYSLTAETATSYWAFWRVWWFGDAFGLLAVTPLAWTLASAWRQRAMAAKFTREVLALAALTAAGTYAIFRLGLHDLAQIPATPLLVLPLVLWSAVRHGLAGAALSGAALTAVAVGSTVRGLGPYAQLPQVDAVLVLQELLAVVLLSALALAALLKDVQRHRQAAEVQSRRRARAEARLREANRLLERKVDERTAELERVNRELRLQAATDPLTGLPNRRHFYERARLEAARARRTGAVAAVILWDLDHFKAINDRYGHEAGDAVLKAAAARVAELLRESDLLARFGGEEFVVLAPDTDLATAAMLAGRLCVALAGQPVRFEDQVIPISASFGVSACAVADGDVDACLRRADAALYRAKKEGRNRVAVAEAPAPLLL